MKQKKRPLIITILLIPVYILIYLFKFLWFLIRGFFRLFGFFHKSYYEKELTREYNKGFKEASSKAEKERRKLINDHEHERLMDKHSYNAEIKRLHFKISTLERDIRKVENMKMEFITNMTQLKLLLRQIEGYVEQYQKRDMEKHKDFLKIQQNFSDINRELSNEARKLIEM